MNSLSRCKPLLGTYVEITLSGNATDHQLIEQSNLAYDAIESVQNAMSFHDSASELSHINRHALQREITLSAPMLTVLSTVTELHSISDGLFDPTVASQLVTQDKLPKIVNSEATDNTSRWGDIEINGDQLKFHSPLLIDLGGIAKGYAVDCAINCIDDRISAVVNAGGDIRFSHWEDQTVCITNPRTQEFEFETSMKNSAIATSASYYNQGQSVIINPHTSVNISSSNSISVFAKSCFIADALTKIVWLSPKYKHILEHYNAQSLILNANNQVIK